jgi:formate dehydrogenase subunit beta
MLKSGLVEEVLAFTYGLDESDIVPFFASSEEDAAKIVIASYQPYSLARLVRDYGDKDKKIGMVVRSCDARAIIELAKRSQVNIDNIYMLGIECYGVAKASTAKGPLYILLDGMDEAIILSHCLRCPYPLPTMADISCCFDKDATAIEVHTKKGEQILALAFNLSPVEREIERDVKAIEERASQRQERDFGELEGRGTEARLQYWFDQFDRCIKCYGCRNVCPLCYCKDCSLEASRALIKGGEVPPETLFHLTRLAHVADSCLNCGQCEAACPMEIPLSKVFHMLHKRLSAIFGYEPGMNIEDLPPLGTISERELKSGGVTLD